MTIVDRVIERAGGVTKLARDIGDIHYSSILGWKKTGVIPSKRLRAVSDVTGIPIDELIERPAPSPEAAA